MFRQGGVVSDGPTAVYEAFESHQGVIPFICDVPLCN